MNFNQSLRWRYATKKFDPNRQVAESIVDSLLESANLTATSYGLQPYQFVVLADKALQESLVASSFGQRQIADASHVIVIAIRTDIDEQYIHRFVDMKEATHGLPTGSMSGYGAQMARSIMSMADPERRDWAARQAYLAMGTLLAACAVEQIDACPMEGFLPGQFNEKLGLTERNLHAQLVLPVGYRSPDDQTQHLTKVRQPLAEIVVRL